MQGMPTRSVCQLEFRCPMSLPRALKESSGCISMTTTFAPSSAARRAVAVPAWPAPHTTMSASTVSAMSLSGMSGSSPSQPAPSTSPMVLPALPVGAALPAADALPAAGPVGGGAGRFAFRAASCQHAGACSPCRKHARALQETAAAELRCGRVSWRRPPFGRRSNEVLSCPRSLPSFWSWLPRFGAVCGRRRLLGCLAVCRSGRVARLVERLDYGAAWLRDHTAAMVKRA